MEKDFLADIIGSLKIDSQFNFWIALFKHSIVQKNFLIDVFNCIDNKYVKIETNTIVYEKYIPNYVQKKSEYFKVELRFMHDVVSAISLYSSSSLISLFELSQQFGDNYAIDYSGREEMTQFVFSDFSHSQLNKVIGISHVIVTNTILNLEQQKDIGISRVYLYR